MSDGDRGDCTSADGASEGSEGQALGAPPLGCALKHDRALKGRMSAAHFRFRNHLLRDPGSDSSLGASDNTVVTAIYVEINPENTEDVKSGGRCGATGSR